MTTYKIPLTPEPQSFFIDLAGITYKLVNLWNPIAQCWVLDFYNDKEIPILRGIPLVTGADLFEQHPNLKFGGKLYAQTEGAKFEIPTFKNIGTESFLYFVTV